MSQLRLTPPGVALDSWLARHGRSGVVARHRRSDGALRGCYSGDGNQSAAALASAAATARRHLTKWSCSQSMGPAVSPLMLVFSCFLGCRQLLQRVCRSVPGDSSPCGVGCLLVQRSRVWAAVLSRL